MCHSQEYAALARPARAFGIEIPAQFAANGRDALDRNLTRVVHIGCDAMNHLRLFLSEHERGNEARAVEERMAISPMPVQAAAP